MNGAAFAADVTWNGGAGTWSTAGNWTPATVPVTSSDVKINVASSQVTHDSGSGAIDTLVIGNSTNTLLINNNSTLGINNGGSNIGTISVDGSGSALGFNGGTFTNTDGTIDAINSGAIGLNGLSMVGGILSSSSGGKFTADNNGSNFLSGVALNGTLDLASAIGVERVTGGLTLNGAVNIGNGSVLAPQGDQTIDGTGTIIFADNNTNNRLNVEAGNLTIGNDITVRGQTGYIGHQAYLGGAASLTNNGSILADVAGGTITIGVNGTVTNNGTLAALNGGTLILDNDILGNVGSQINAGNGSTILQRGVTLNGVINNPGTGLFRATNNGSNIFNNVSFTGALDLASAIGVERVTGGLTLNGAVNIGNGSVLAPQGDQTIDGTGTIIFADNNTNNRLNVEAGNLTIGNDITVRGQTGYIGHQTYLGGAASLTNNGSILADVAGGTITIGVNGTVTNNGTLAALNGGTLILDNSIVGNVGSQINAGNGSTILQRGVTLNGVINNPGTGSFRATNNGSNIFNNVSFTGALDLASAIGSERVTGGLTLNGAVNIGNGSVLAPQGDQTIGGTGTIIFADDNTNNRLNVEAGDLTIGNNITVRGQTGFIGHQAYLGGAATLTNQGLISADVGGGTITVDINGSLINQGTMRAQNGGQLILNSMSGGVNNSTGTLLADDVSTVFQNGVTITGGELNSNGSGVFKASNSSANYLNNVNFTGELDLASAQSAELVTGGLTLNGAVNIGNGSVLAPQGDQTIGGTGTIVFTDGTANNRLNVDAGNLTIGSGITVRGQTGFIGQQAYLGGAATLTNQGLVSADVAGGTITVDINGSLINQGTMRAQNGGQLTLNSMSGGVNNNTGTLLADVGSTVFQNGVTITGGALNSNGSGVFKAANSSANYLNGVTLNGVLDLASAVSTERISAGGMTLNGTINIGNGSTLAPEGDQTIGGAGTIIFADANAGNHLNVEAGNLTIGSGITVRGQTGLIGHQSYAGGAATLTNNGTLNADAGGTITVNVNGALTNNGTMRAQNGTLSIQEALTGTGTLQVDSTGVMNLANIANTQGRLVMGAAGSTLNIGTKDLTINTDYTNVAAGSGNDFTRRAGVNETGKILAGGGATQVIAGSNITNGDTNNATLTIGNVHVGSNTFNYQINDSSSTGPILRGAIQTDSIHGANLTDGRLSGSGVTASNYSSSAGPLAVTYTASSDGAQTLSGQVLNLTSNFDNIADQKLNIVFGSGAAAYNLAVGSTGDVVVANQRVNGSNTAALTVSNNAPSGSFTEALNASFAGHSGDVTNISGAITGGTGSGVAGGSSSGAMTVGIDTLTYGAKYGTVTLDYVSNGTGSSGLGNTAVGAQTVNVTGNVYQVAQTTSVPTSLNLGNVHVGGGASQAIAITNTNIASGFQEGLDASTKSTTNATGSGSISNLVAGGTSSGITLGMTNASAGVNSGSVTLQLGSNGTGTSGLSTLSLADKTVDVSLTGYRLAQGSTAPSPINFGYSHVGDAVSQALKVQNTAVNDGFSEKLTANFSVSGTSGAATNNGGSINQLAAGGSNSSDMAVGLNTSSAGHKTGSVKLDYVSDGAGTSGLSAIGAGDQTVTMSGDVFNLANPIFNKLLGSGTLSQNGLQQYTLDFGSIVQNTVTAATLQLLNYNGDANFTDFVNGSYGSHNSAVATLQGFDTFTNLAASINSGINDLSVLFNTSTIGTFTDSITLTWYGHNAGWTGTTSAIQLFITGNITTDGQQPVPEPGTMILFGAGLAGLAGFSRKRKMA